MRLESAVTARARGQNQKTSSSTEDKWRQGKPMEEAPNARDKPATAGGANTGVKRVKGQP